MENEVDLVVDWIKTYIKNSGAKGVVIGNSGGKDCATAIALANKALGKEKVLTITIPCNSIKEDMEDAKLISDAFGVKLLEVDITNIYKQLEIEIEKNIKYENEFYSEWQDVYDKIRKKLETFENKHK